MKNFLCLSKNDKLLYKYSDKNGIKIFIINEYENELVKNDVGNFILIRIYTKKDFITCLVDYCITECVYLIDDLFASLDKIKKAKVAKRWLWRTIKDMEFGNTGYKVKDLYNRSSKKIDDKEIEEKYNKYWDDKSKKAIS